MSAKTVVLAGKIYTPLSLIEGGAAIIEDGKIADLVRGAPELSGAALVDVRPHILAPGFVEVHINGAGGADAAEGSFGSLEQISQTLARHGTTAFVPAIITAPEEDILSSLRRLSQALESKTSGAEAVGIYLEGPFLNPRRRGAHPAEHIRQPDLSFLERAWLASQGKLKVLALAPELPNALTLIRRARQLGVVVAIGHSDATYEEALAGIDAGATLAVHVFNAMRQFGHRDPGIIAAVIEDDRIFGEVIADGVHVHPAAVRLLVRAKSSDKIVLATDAISAAGMPDGRYRLGNRWICVQGGVCRDEEGKLAGSTLMQDQGLRNMIAWCRIPFPLALATVTLNPAEALGLKNKGRIAAGADADLVVLSSEQPDLKVLKTFVGGKVVYTNGPSQEKKEEGIGGKA